VPFRGAAEGWREGLLVRRRIAEPDELAFYLTPAPAATPPAALVRIAGTRWTSEACFEAAKGEVGLDHDEVRSWTGWHRHVTLALLAHAYLTVVRRAAIGGRRGARSHGRPVLPLTPCRSAPARPAAGVGAPARSRPGRRLVNLAPPAPAAGRVPGRGVGAAA
jgi:hypothetical protein